MRRLGASRHFQKQLKKLPIPDQIKVVEKLKGFLKALSQSAIPAGYGFKKVNGDKYEIRVDQRIRVLMKLDQDVFVCHVVGGHEEIRRYLRDYRHQ